MQRLVMKIMLKSPANHPLLFLREESECQALLVLRSLLSVFLHSVNPCLQLITMLRSPALLQLKTSPRVQIDTEYTRPGN